MIGLGISLSLEEIVIVFSFVIDFVNRPSKSKHVINDVDKPFFFFFFFFCINSINF